MKLIRSTHPKASNRGLALIYAVLGSFMAASIAALLFTASGMTHVRSKVSHNQTQADYLAQGAVEAAKKAIQTAVANWSTPPTSGTATMDGISVPYTITPTGSNVTVTDAAGIETQLVGYEVAARSEVDGIVSWAHRIINTEATPILQFAVFYEEDLEIQPGPAMTFQGKVHSNGDIYVGGGSSIVIDTNYLRCVGSMYRRAKDDGDSSGTVLIRRWVQDPFDASEPYDFETMANKAQMGSVSSVSGYDSDFPQGYDSNGDGDFDDGGEMLPFPAGALDLWGEPSGYSASGNTVMTGAHGVGEIKGPQIEDIAMYEPVAGGDYYLDSGSGEYEFAGTGLGTHNKGFYHGNAGLSFIISANGNTVRGFDGTGTELSSSDFDDSVSTDTVYDARQGGDVPVLVIDMDELGESSIWPSNGLLYVAHYGMGTGTDAKGVQLTDGSELVSGLAVVSEGSLYVHGDYNTVNKVGASVTADAVNLLSNEWDGSKSGGKLPKAGNTTYNIALLTGNTLTTDGSYNGGLENLPRFHERWTGLSCEITGAFICAWSSQYATAPWSVGGNYYAAPRRSWFYDEDYGSASNLPPWTPTTTSVADVVSW